MDEEQVFPGLRRSGNAKKIFGRRTGITIERGYPLQAARNRLSNLALHGCQAYIAFVHPARIEALMPMFSDAIRLEPAWVCMTGS